MRSHLCGLVDESLTGSRVALCGWVEAVRHMGGLCFLDLRDHEGLVQVVLEPNTPPHALAAELRAEDCLRVQGVVRPRLKINEKLRTGRVEVLAERLELLNRARDLPFALHEQPGEELRLRYRWLDLRRPRMQRLLRLRARLISALRRWLEGRGFVEIETPILTKATPEGARDFLVPARLHPGCFYALPQSPQLFKQILMIAGFDRYYQVARCFRDEALRADRQLEFTQLDLELAWVEEADVQATVEAMVREVLAEVAGIALPDPFPRLSYEEAMRRFGSDKPDLRVPLELRELTALLRESGFRPFAEAASRPDGRIAGLPLPGGAALSRKQIDGLAAEAARHGLRNLGWIRAEDPARGREGLQSPLLRHLADGELAGIIEAAGIRAGDLLLLAAGGFGEVSQALGALRLRAAETLGLVAEGWRPLWVTDFPMFEFDAAERRWVAVHHPFTAPRCEEPAELLHNPAGMLSRAYDLVLNGHEIGGGSIRIHRPEMQQAVFALLGIEPEEAEAKFGFLLEALRHGAPPHGGIALGLDRIAALIGGVDSIREVIAFPKTTTAQCPMTGAPSAVAPEQWAELHLRPAGER
ncbi:MAG: aspartate--tRNA ligase [Xanthomonadales bacterium]|nr:aspartate--tRNA ligase [Xanthomonadales bacterium]